MTSNYEGSPNIIKEAMACNCPIISTDVGDVGWVVGNTEGCYLISEKIKDQSKKNEAALIKETSKKLKHKENNIEELKFRSADVQDVASELKEALKFAEQFV